MIIKAPTALIRKKLSTKKRKRFKIKNFKNSKQQNCEPSIFDTRGTCFSLMKTSLKLNSNSKYIYNKVLKRGCKQVGHWQGTKFWFRLGNVSFAMQ